MGAAEKLPDVGKVVEKVVSPVLKRASGSYATALDIAKLELWRSYSSITPKAEWGRLAETIDNAVGIGRMEAIGLSRHRISAERMVFFAPSYYRSFINLLATATTSGGVPGRVALNMLGGQAAAALFLFSGSALALGLSWDEIRRRLDPTRGKFMTVPVEMPDGTKTQVGFGGMMLQGLRSSAQFAEYLKDPPPEDTGVLNNPVLRYFRGRQALFPSLYTDLALGRDYLGNRLTIRQSLANTVTPFWVSSFFPKDDRPTNWQRSSDAFFNFFGLRSFPESEYEAEKAKIDKLAQEKHGAAFSDLPIGKRRNVIKSYQAQPDYQKRVSTLDDQKRFIEFAEKRRLQLENSLDPATRERLNQLGVQVRGFRSTVTAEGVNVPLTDAEQARYAELLRDLYDSRVSKLNVAYWQRMPSVKREENWGKFAANLAKTARAKLQAEINKAR